MRTADFDFELPPELIAQAPAPQRDQSRLLELRRESGEIAHRQFRDLPGYLRPGDVLVLNNSRVIPARLRGFNAQTDGEFELLLLEENATNDWWAMVRPGKRARPGTQIELRNAEGNPAGVRTSVLEKNEEGHRRLIFSGTPDIALALEALGEVPLPPYIERSTASSMDLDRQRYQTVFAEPAGSVAAPTAGLHFTESLLDEIRARGVHVCFVTLHVGPGTFAPVKAETLAGHRMHEERYELSEVTARTINEAKHEGRRIVAVGTTTLRVLESVVAGEDWERRHPCRRHHCDEKTPAGTPALPVHSTEAGPLLSASTVRVSSSPSSLRAGTGRTRIFIYPPFELKIVDALVTNFHLPRSTLLMLVCAFAAPEGTRGRELVLSAYREAIRERYRFFSYGDAMLIL
jgi:S-adenosylmethionine:tRNA ribosyltransferase-isomerase